MTPHDRIRRDRAHEADWNDEESLIDAIRGLQSTDDPSLVPLHDQLMSRLEELRKAKKAEVNDLSEFMDDR